jgi:hypothetical protein
LDWQISKRRRRARKSQHEDRLHRRQLCGVDNGGLPSFAQTQAATDGERNVHLVYYAFDLLHLADWDVSQLPLIERKALLEPLVANKPGLQFNGHDTGDGELILKHDGKLGFEGVVSRRSMRPTRLKTEACGAKPKPFARPSRIRSRARALGRAIQRAAGLAGGQTPDSSLFLFLSRVRPEAWGYILLSRTSQPAKGSRQ